MKPIPNDIFFAQVESEIAAGRSVIFKVKGNSMYPFLRNGIDSVKLVPVNQQLVKNVVVIFKYNGNYILHRIVKIEGDTYIMQGDGVIKTREYCRREDIFGVVTHICRNGGTMVPLNSFKLKFLVKSWLSLSFLRRYLIFFLKKSEKFLNK